MVCCEQLFDTGNVCSSNFQNTSLTGNFGQEIRLPDGHFGQFRAIGPMELLRPDNHSHKIPKQHFK